MILRRQFFQQLNGFDETLNTGEDYDISQRARAAGAKIVLDDALKAEHWGFPRTLGAFIRREMWHGASDFRSVRSILASRVALMTVGFVTLHIALIIGAVLGSALVVLPAALGIAGLCVLSALRKYSGQSAHVIVIDSMLFYTYYIGRAASAFRARASHSSPRRTAQ
jgi:hypothetical protein